MKFYGIIRKILGVEKEIEGLKATIKSLKDEVIKINCERIEYISDVQRAVSACVRHSVLLPSRIQMVNNPRESYKVIEDLPLKLNAYTSNSFEIASCEAHTLWTLQSTAEIDPKSLTRYLHVRFCDEYASIALSREYVEEVGFSEEHVRHLASKLLKQIEKEIRK